MSSPVETKSIELLRSGLTADRIFDLANACSDMGRAQTPILLWLGLAAFFRKIAHSIHDRPVETAEVDRLWVKLKPLLETLSKPQSSAAPIEQKLSELRDLI